MLSVIGSGGSLAQDDARVARDPPVALMRGAAESSPAATMRAEAASPAARGRRGIGNEIFYDLEVRYEKGSIYNPATGKRDKVELRSYVGPAADQRIPFVGPLVELWPGETFRMGLFNNLPVADPSCTGSEATNTLRCFNSLNNHAHGLFVSPSGNSDNVLLTIRPGVRFQYEYNIPSDHPAGTFWYHSHLHGSTAVQVSSGMAGPLIIRGDRPPALQADGSISQGDIDTLLREPGGKPFRERVVLFQQIAYACRDATGIKRNPDNSWRCDEGDVGTIEKADQLAPTAWPTSRRHTALNGEVLPTFRGASANTIERWRVIHGGIRNTVRLRFRKLAPDAEAAVAAFRATSEAAQQAFVDQHCTGAPLTTFSIATDGLTRPFIHERIDTYFQPGYREDLLISFPEKGTYCVIDGELEPVQVVNGQPHGRELLGYVRVGDGPGNDGMTARDRILSALILAAAEHMPAPVRGRVISDLASGLKLTGFMHHAPISTVDGNQSVGFNIAPGPRFVVGEIDAGGALINAEPYDHTKYRVLVLGKAEEWKLRSFGGGGHPFHIHVNPFEIVSIIREADGVDVSALTDTGLSQFAGMKGTWKDTIFLQPGHLVTFRTRYERYIGDFVLHCHILDHEDQGMMQNVRVAIPDSTGAPTGDHH
ncbi:multicopper oxidase family protein [Methylobacterium oryzisoli]|uniref:multicopper oxidase family protein n=1 Tax=Methylobacterium oryzisoli TaxID=3385502 RepID=UPI003891F6DA